MITFTTDSPDSTLLTWTMRGDTFAWVVHQPIHPGGFIDGYLCWRTGADPLTLLTTDPRHLVAPWPRTLSLPAGCPRPGLTPRRPPLHRQVHGARAPDLHRRLVLEAAEAGVSPNRLASAKLNR